MTNKLLKTTFLLMLICFAIMGCTKNYTNYYPDAEAPELAIFSNKSNNLMTCFIDGKPWLTDARTTSLFLRPNYEVYIERQVTVSPMDTLTITWNGYYKTDKNLPGYINLVLPVAKNFTFKDITSFSRRRFDIDTTNGFFSTSTSGLQTNNTKGSGHIYFHLAKIDSIAPEVYSGTMSGLFEADFTSFKIANGRFDHSITPEQVRF